MSALIGPEDRHHAASFVPVLRTSPIKFNSLPGAYRRIMTHIDEPGSPGFLRIGPSFTTGTPTPKITLFAGELSGPFTGLHIGLSHSIEMAQAQQLKPRKTGLEAVGFN